MPTIQAMPPQKRPKAAMPWLSMASGPRPSFNTQTKTPPHNKIERLTIHNEIAIVLRTRISCSLAQSLLTGYRST